MNQINSISKGTIQKTIGITGCAISTARREHKLVRAILGKTKRRLTVKEYCNYFEFDYTEVVEYINPFR